MIEFEVARTAAESEIRRMSLASDCEMVMLDHATLTTTFGWVFFYQSKKYLETGESSHILAGNAPIIVDRDDGSLHLTGTARPTEEYIRAYETFKASFNEKFWLVLPALSLTQLKVVRQVLSLSLTQVGALRSHLPGRVLAGSRQKLELMLASLATHDIQASIEEESWRA